MPEIPNIESGKIKGGCSAIFMALAATLILIVQSSAAQDSELDTLTMDGTLAIDPNERISGQATVGINFYKEDEKFDPDTVWVYFEDKPIGELKTQVTTVDGRYVLSASAMPREDSDLSGSWRRLQLRQKDTKEPLSTGFLKKNYNEDDEDREIAILVTDENNRAYPVRWGTGCATNDVRIRVNAEGADAYFVSFDNENSKAELRKCDRASDKTQFKFDHNCDMRLQDIDELDEVKIIRKRGATYETAIPVRISVPRHMSIANASRECDG